MSGLHKKSLGTQQMVKAESLDLRQGKIFSPHFYPTKPPSVLWVWGGKEQKGEEGKGHVQLNKTEGWNEAKIKKKEDKEGRMRRGKYE